MLRRGHIGLASVLVITRDLRRFTVRRGGSFGLDLPSVVWSLAVIFNPNLYAFRGNHVIDQYSPDHLRFNRLLYRFLSGA